MYKRWILTCICIIMASMFFVGCASKKVESGQVREEQDNTVDTGFAVTGIGDYDSADTAVILGIDKDNRTITLMNMETGRQYTLYYDGTTYFKDKYEGGMTVAQYSPGQIVEVQFLKAKKQLSTMRISADAWEYMGIDNYNLGGINQTASVGSATYNLPKGVVILSPDGSRLDVMDIVEKDIITVRGIEHQICSIVVERGHGYLRLKNDSALIGGWIEVGNKVIREITEDMLLAVPEGKYDVSMMNGNVRCKKEVTIERNRELILDVSDLEIIGDKMGTILFSVNPTTAEVMVDGTKIDISEAITLPYGIHQVYIEAEGYDSLMKYIQVGSDYAAIEFALEEKKQEELEESYPTTSNSTTSSSETTEEINLPTSGNKVYIDSPKEVEVYVDGNYVGISPVSFKKTVGSHTITLRKNNYQSKSYTIYLYSDGEDITYSFADLEKADEGSSAASTSSNSTKSTDSEKNAETGSVNAVSGNSVNNYR